MSWDPFKDGKTAVRGGYSLAFVNEETVTVGAGVLGGNAGLSTAVAPSGLYAKLGAGVPAIQIPQFKSTRTLADQLAPERDGHDSRRGRGHPAAVRPSGQRRHLPRDPVEHGGRGALRRHVRPEHLPRHRSEPDERGRRDGRGVPAGLRARAAERVPVAGRRRRVRSGLRRPGQPAADRAAAIRTRRTRPSGPRSSRTSRRAWRTSTSPTGSRGPTPRFCRTPASTPRSSSPTARSRTTTRCSSSCAGSSGRASPGRSTTPGVKPGRTRWARRARIASSRSSTTRVRELDEGRSLYHTGHVINSNVIVELPFGHGKRWLNGGRAARRPRRRLADGRHREVADRIADLHPVHARHVQPRRTLRPPDRGDVAERGPGQEPVRRARRQRHDVLHRPEGHRHDRAGRSGPTRWREAGFNGQVFFNPGAGEVGSMEILAFDGPSQFLTDLSISKRFRIAGRYGVSFRADIFNLFNTVNFFARRPGREQRELRQADRPPTPARVWCSSRGRSTSKAARFARGKGRLASLARRAARFVRGRGRSLRSR